MLGLQKNFNSECFVKFHAMFELLRAELLSVILKQQTSTLGELYPGALVSASAASSAMLQEVIPLRMRELEEDERQVKKHLSKAWCAERANRVVLPASGNLGFDMAIPLDGNRLLVIDTKCSTPRADTAAGADLNLAQYVIDSRNKLNACMRAISGTCTAFSAATVSELECPSAFVILNLYMSLHVVLLRCSNSFCTSTCDLQGRSPKLCGWL
jgi:hypothetical protein